MEISPLILLLLLLYSGLFGIGLGILNDVHRIIRVFFGVRYSEKHFDRLYERKIPVIKRSLGEYKVSPFRKRFLNVLIFFQDIWLFFVAAVGIIILNYEWNQGVFRFFTVFATVIGFLLWYFTLGRPVMLASEAIVFVIRATCIIIFSVLARPFRFFAIKIMNISKKFYIAFQKALAKKRKKLYNRSRKTKLLKEASEGFLNLPSLSLSRSQK